MRHVARTTVGGLISLLVMLALAACARHPQYSDEIRSALQRAYHDFGDYTFRGTPVGNFGVGTMYLKEVKFDPKHVERSWLIGHPDTWFSDSVTTEEKEALLQNIFVPAPLGDARLEESISTRLGLEVTMPVTKLVLTAGVKLELERGVKVTVSAANAVNRRMNWTEFTRAIKKDKIKPEVAGHVARRDYVIAAADILLNGYKAKVAVDRSVNADLHARLTKALGTVLGKDIGLEIKISRSADGTFDIEATNPVVAAVLYKEPPAPPLGIAPFGRVAADDIAEWPTVRIDNKVLRPLEELLSGIATIR